MCLKTVVHSWTHLFYFVIIFLSETIYNEINHHLSNVTQMVCFGLLRVLDINFLHNGLVGHPFERNYKILAERKCYQLIDMILECSYANISTTICYNWVKLCLQSDKF